MSNIESREYREYARANCYRYGCLDVYMDSDVSLDDHNFPNYSSRSSSSALEKFLSLMQGLGNTATGNDPLQKLPRTLPTVQWGDDSLDLSISLDGKMYFKDFQDYTRCKGRLREMMLAQGWTVNSTTTLGIPVTSYQPTSSGTTALYADDPVDAAGMAMMVNAVQHTTAELEVTKGLMTHDMESYASGMAKKAARAEGAKQGLADYGFIGNFKAGLEAIGANSSGGIVAKWTTAGYPVQLVIDGTVVRSSVNCILRSAKFTENSFVIDSSSNGGVYPTCMDVNISMVNVYGSLLTTMKAGG